MLSRRLTPPAIMVGRRPVFFVCHALTREEAAQPGKRDSQAHPAPLGQGNAQCFKRDVLASQKAGLSVARSSTRRDRTSPHWSLDARLPVARRRGFQRIAVEGATPGRKAAAAIQPFINRRQKPRTQLRQERGTHPCQPASPAKLPSPAKSLNQKSPPERRPSIQRDRKPVQFIELNVRISAGAIENPSTIPDTGRKRRLSDAGLRVDLGKARTCRS